MTDESLPKLVFATYLADEWELWREAMADGEEHFSESFAEWESSMERFQKVQREKGIEVVLQVITLDAFLGFAKAKQTQLVEGARGAYANELCSSVPPVLGVSFTRKDE